MSFFKKLLSRKKAPEAEIKFKPEAFDAEIRRCKEAEFDDYARQYWSLDPEERESFYKVDRLHLMQ